MTEKSELDSTSDQVKEKSDYSWLVFFRHIVAGLFVLLAQPPAVFHARGFLATWLGAYIAVLLISLIVVALALLFFTKREKSRWRKTFVTSMWFFIGLHMLSWLGPPFGGLR